MERNDLPLGFAFALAQAPDAMKRFSALSGTERAELLQKAHHASSKGDIQALVNSLSVSAHDQTTRC